MPQAIRMSPDEIARRQAARAPSIVPQVQPAGAQAVRTPTATAATTQSQISARVSDIGARSAQTQANAAAARTGGYPSARGIEVMEQAAPKTITPAQVTPRPTGAGPARYPTAAGIEVTEGAASGARTASITEGLASRVGGGALRVAKSVGGKVLSGVSKAAPLAAATAGISAAAESAGTPTSAYRRRLGLDPNGTPDGALGLASDVGVRTVGALTDVGNAAANIVSFGAWNPSANFADKRDAARAAETQAAAPAPVSNAVAAAPPQPNTVPGQTIIPTKTADTAVPEIKTVEPVSPTSETRKVYSNVPDSEETKQLASGRNLISIVPSEAAAAGAAGALRLPATGAGGASGVTRGGGGGMDREGQLRDMRERDLIDTAKKSATERSNELKRLVGASEAALASGKRKTAAIYANLAGNYSGSGGITDLSGFARAQQQGQTEAQRQQEEAMARRANAEATQAELTTQQQQRVATLMQQFEGAKDEGTRGKLFEQLQSLTGSKTKPSVVDIATGDVDLEGRPVTVKGLADSNGNIIYSPITQKPQQ